MDDGFRLIKSFFVKKNGWALNYRLRKKNFTFLLLISAPGSNPDSIKIWNPLQIPIIGYPDLDFFIISFIIGENLAIAPVLK